MRFHVHIAVALLAKENTSHYSTSLNPCMLPVDRLVRKLPAKIARLIAALIEKTPWWTYMEFNGLNPRSFGWYQLPHTFMSPSKSDRSY